MLFVIVVFDLGIIFYFDLNVYVLLGYNFVSWFEYVNNGGVGCSGSVNDFGDVLI